MLSNSLSNKPRIVANIIPLITPETNLSKRSLLNDQYSLDDCLRLSKVKRIFLSLKIQFNSIFLIFQYLLVFNSVYPIF